MKRMPLFFVGFAALLCSSASSHAQPISEGFDSVSNLTSQGWGFVTNTPQPRTAGAWRQGSDDDGGTASPSFAPQAGAAGSYIRSDYTQSSASTSVTISDWMFLPTRTLRNGDTLSFFARRNSSAFDENLIVRLSTNGASTNVGSTPDSVGDFTTVLRNINPTPSTSNPNFPTNWTQYNITISGLSGPTSGRIALHHYLQDSGPNGNYGDELGVDTLSYTPVPEPTSLALCSLAVAGGYIAKRRKDRRKQS